MAVLSSALAALLSAPAALASEPMLVLKQHHRLFGEVTVYITKSAAKIETAGREKVFLCSAPSWDAIV